MKRAWARAWIVAETHFQVDIGPERTLLVRKFPVNRRRKVENECRTGNKVHSNCLSLPGSTYSYTGRGLSWERSKSACGEVAIRPLPGTWQNMLHFSRLLLFMNSGTHLPVVRWVGPQTGSCFGLWEALPT